MTPRLHDGLRLVSIPSAIPCSQLFVEYTLDKWGAYTLIQEGRRVVKELVINAVAATGIPEDRLVWTELPRIEFITVRLLGLEDRIRIEVWDSAPNPPVLPDPAGSPVKRGTYPTPRGKVVWAELPLLPHGPNSHVLRPPPEEHNPYLLRRVRDGLDSL